MLVAVDLRGFNVVVPLWVCLGHFTRSTHGSKTAGKPRGCSSLVELRPNFDSGNIDMKPVKQIHAQKHVNFLYIFRLFHLFFLR